MLLVKPLMQTFLLMDTQMTKSKKLYQFSEMTSSPQNHYGLKSNLTSAYKAWVAAVSLPVVSHQTTFKTSIQKQSSSLTSTK